MRKKHLILTVICLLMLTLLLSACHDDPDTTPPVTDGPNEGNFLVTVEDTAAVTVQSNLELGQRVAKGTEIRFTLKISDLYEGTPEVYAGDKKLTANEQGMYSFTVEADTVISVKGLTLRSSAMSGSGTEDDPFLVTIPADMVFIAEQVNAGNSTYISGYYSLENNIDCGGMELAIIGDGNTDAAVFAGYFAGNGYTISNFFIESDGTQYVGLFGVLQADVSGGNGGNIVDLHLDDFTIDASISDSGAFIGSMVGYGMGSNLILCSATNGTIYAYADTNNFSYVGGLVGLQQAMDYYSYAYYSSVSYCYADVDLNCNSGLVYAAGGLIGYLSESSANVVASVNNCYAHGDVYGAMRSGGLVGYMTSNTAVVNSYATGKVSAQSETIDKVNAESFCYAYAGGIAGYAASNTIVSGCFSESDVQAVAKLGGAYQCADGILGHAAEPEEYEYGHTTAMVHNCYGKSDSFDKKDVFTKLYWQKLDWTFDDNGYPVVNVTDEDDDFFFTLTFVIDGTEQQVELTKYMPLHFWYRYEEDGVVAIPVRMTAEEGSTRISYGYFFDKDYTQPVPAGFIPNHDMTIYAATADVADVVGEYELVLPDSDQPIRLVLDAHGICTYTDAGQTNTCGYIYNGETILFEEARFGRFASGELELNNYQYYDFIATIDDDGSLRIVGGAHDSDDGYSTVLYFTEKSPLIAAPLKEKLSGTYTDGSAIYTFRQDGTGAYDTADDYVEFTYMLSGDKLTVEMAGEPYTGTVTADGLTLNGKTLRAPDAFVGSWHVDTKAEKIYTFDGMGTWQYRYNVYKDGVLTTKTVLRGTYSVDKNGVLTFNDLNATAKFVDGVLQITIDGNTVSCHKNGSFYGTWFYTDYGLTLTLKGIKADGQGAARIEYLYENGTVEAYDLIYAIDEQHSDRICLYYDGDVFGYMQYTAYTDKLDATIYVGSLGTFMSRVPLSTYDDYKGEWVGQIDTMPTLRFDGLGSYSDGKLTIGEVKIPYALNDASLEGSFTYKNVTYAISYNEAEQTITLTYGDGETAIYHRKDAFGDTTLTDGKDNVYTFDGRDTLSGQGTMYVNGSAAYTYEVVGDELILYSNGVKVGSITIDEEKREYKLSLPNVADTNLRIKLAISRIWALSNSPDAYMTIGTMDLDGNIKGIINGKKVTFKLEEDGSLAFKFPGNDTQFYLIPAGETNMVVSMYKDWYLYGDQIECAVADDLIGTWSSYIGGAYKFDGMGNSTLTTALAQSGVLAGTEFIPSTAFGYAYENGQWVLWSVSSTTGETRIYRLNFCDVNTKYAFVNADGTKAFLIEEGNRLYKMEALEESTAITYTFDGFGKVTTSDGNTYDYECISVDEKNYTAVAEITIDGTVMTATIDYASEIPTLTLEAK